MYLKKIEIKGFKSFADRVVFELSHGVTGFVGPNGCGKSNVVDAVKWGLGEQRYSSLRGESMQDVIFKGSAERPPVNFAEVSLYLDNTGGTLPLEYEEVVITRRLFRSGESEYLLNRQPCRLKDVRNLFLDTGVGVNAYAIMEQGKIDTVLQLDPLSRRSLFEEAAGISRYKTRRREAERKLERTQGNLLRVGDLLEELERRIRSLKNQAGRARNYLKYTERLGRLQRVFLLNTYRSHREEEARLAREREEAERAARETREAVERLRREKEAQEEALEGLSASLAEKRTESARIKVSIEETGKRITYLEQRRAEAARDAETLAAREQGLRETLKDREAAEIEIRRRWESLREDERRIDGEEVRVQAELRRVEADWQRVQNDLHRLEGEALDTSRREVDLRNRQVEVESRLKALRAAFERLMKRQNGLAREIAASRQELAEGERSRGALMKDRERLRRRLERARDEESLRAQGLQRLEEGLREIEAERIKVESRIELLQNLLDKREGVAGGVKAILEEASSVGSSLAFVKGLLGELVETDLEHSAALEAALGEGVEALVVEDLEHAARLVSYVHEKGGGRITVFPLSEFTGGVEGSAPGGLAERVRSRDPRVLAAVRALLSRVRLIAPEELTRSRRGEGPAKCVTLRGDAVDTLGILFVGGPSREPGLIARRSEREALERQRRSIVERLEACRKERDEARAALDDANLERRGIRDALEGVKGRITKNTAEQEERRERWRRLRREYDLNAVEAAELEVTLDRLRVEHTELSAEAERLREDVGRLESALAEVRDGEGVCRAARDRVMKEKQFLQVQRIRFRERGESLEKERRMVEESLAEARSRLEDLQRDRVRLTETARDLGEQIRDMQARTEALLESRSSLASSLAELEEALERERAVSERILVETARANEAMEAARERLEQLRLEERERAVKREGLVEKAREELEIDLEGNYETLAVELEENWDWPEVEREITELKERIARIGNVNLEAIHELEEVEARFASLSAQREDLVKSIRGLTELIQQLNRESRQRFAATFETVRRHFNEIFRKLFQGGRADLRLQEGADILEAGVEIVAGPPGKEVRSINLLSGGERSLTAVGLLFALFKSRPSPFCILDEVDAALDELNVESFCGLLGDYVKDTQFIIISHSKRTMSFCDFLYGITMPEPGVSSKIALDLSEYEDRVA